MSAILLIRVETCTSRVIVATKIIARYWVAVRVYLTLSQKPEAAICHIENVHEYDKRQE